MKIHDDTKHVSGQIRRGVTCVTFCAAVLVSALVHPNAVAQVPSPTSKNASVQADVPASKAAALKKYPDLAKAGTEFNRAFVERLGKLRTEQPDFFKDSAWPMKLADEVAATRQLADSVTASTNDATPTSAPDASAARKEAPYANTLGMKFVPVPSDNGTNAKQCVLFSVWETRVRDYEAFAKAEEAAGRKVDGNWKTANMSGVPVGQEPDHPVVSVVRGEAQAFCRWITEKETATGGLAKGAVYRLPTEEEWHRAAGLENQGDFLWGKDVSPPGKVGNFADESFHQKFPPNGPGNKWLEGYDDGFATTSPVGSFPSNKYGIYDMTGNVWEWCEDSFGEGRGMLLGSSWNDGDSRMLRPRSRSIAKPGLDRYNMYGFRCVLAMPAHVEGNASPTFVGEWCNKDFDTDGVTRIHIRQKGTSLIAHMWGRAVPNEADWGESTAEIQEDGKVLSITWKTSYKIETQKLKLLSDGTLELTGHYHSTDNRGRDYESKGVYEKGLIHDWTDHSQKVVE